MNRRVPIRLMFALLVTGVAIDFTIDAKPTWAAGGATIVRAVTQYFGKESAAEATQWMTKSGGRELAERLSAKATVEGGEATVKQVADLANRYGPDAVRALDNAPTLRPVLIAIDELPAQQVGPALARLSAGEPGKELAEAVSRYGTGAMRAELKHPGVGVRYANRLGSEGVELAEKLTAEQAVAIGRHIDDIAKLPPLQRSELLAMISAHSDRFAGFVADFVKQNPGKTLFTLSGTALVLANKDAIFGGDKIVLDKDGNPVLMSTQGLLQRAASRATTEVGDRFVSPLVAVLVPLAAILVAAYGSIKLFGIWRRQQRALRADEASSSHTSH